MLAVVEMILRSRGRWFYTA